MLALSLALAVAPACADEEPEADGSSSASDAASDAAPLPDGSSDVQASTDSAAGAPDAAPCSPVCSGRQCGPDGCGGLCGLCAPGQTCNLSGMCVATEGKQPFGAACGVTDTCGPTAPAGSASWPGCLDAQCASGACHLPYCSRPCQFSKDTVDNVTGEPYPDGIEDEDVPNSCSDAADGPVGSTFRCVDIAPSTALDPITYCVPGTKFAACKRTADCPPGEVCDAITINGELTLRCQGGVVTPTAALGSHCSLADTQDRPLCVSPFLCTPTGCTAWCDDNADCLTPGASCDAATSTCKAAPDKPCAVDADCSEWRCVHKSPDARVPGAGLCAPRTCAVDGDCETPGFHCRTHATFDQVPPSWAHQCVAAPPGATLTAGEQCTNAPEDALVCTNPDLCYKGQCSAHCTTDADCAVAAGQVCAAAEIPFDVDGDQILDVVLPLPVCEPVPHTGPLVECATDLDCPSGETCGPLETAAPQGAPYPFQIRQVCRSMPESFGGYGAPCGPGPGAGECRIGFCITDDVLGAVPDLCSRTCTTAGDCPAKVTIDGKEHPSVCRAVIYGWNGTVERNDDLYVPVCWPVGKGSNLLDCGKDLSCGAPDHACVAWPIATDPTLPSTLEYLCVSNRGPDGEPATGQVGDPCTTPFDCASLLCLPEKKGGAGYCSSPCMSDVDCLGGGPFMVCDPHVVIDRKDDALDVITPQCRKARSCLPCKGDTDCVSGHVCVNIGGKSFVDLRCAPKCTQDQDCASTDGGPKCKASVSSTGVADGVKACIPQGCSDN